MSTKPGLYYRKWLMNRLRDPRQARAYLMAALLEPDWDAVLLAVRDVEEAWREKALKGR